MPMAPSWQVVAQAPHPLHLFSSICIIFLIIIKSSYQTIHVIKIICFLTFWTDYTIIISLSMFEFKQEVIFFERIYTTFDKYTLICWNKGRRDFTDTKMSDGREKKLC